MKKTAYSYIRMSTALQLKGDSLRRQTEESRRYAEANNLQIDDSLNLMDLGVSAFHGDNADTGALSRFLQAIGSGRVSPGSTLLIESLDRLTRQKISSAMPLFLNIVERGVTIVTLSDGKVYSPGNPDPMPLIQSLLIMARAHEESHIKSQRVSAAWESKRRNILQRKMTSRAPAWLSLSADKTTFEIVPENTKVVRMIFDLAEAGLGHFAICRKLNRECVPTFGRAPVWGESYVEKILHNRSVFGEFQPHRKVDGRRVPSGEPVKDYFPCVVGEDQFLRVQAQRRLRGTNSGGRRGANQANLFTHIARCAECGAAMRFINKGKPPKGGRYLRCSNSLLGLGCSATPWRYETFETAFLAFCAEADLVSVAEAEKDSSAARDARQQHLANAERLALAEARREKIYGLIDTTDDVAFLKLKLDDCNAEIRELSAVVADAAPSISSRRVGIELIEQIRFFQQDGDTSSLEARVRMATRLRSIVSSLHLGAADLSLGAAAIELAAHPHLDQVIRDDHSSDNLPGFVVKFVDGATRHVTVAPGDGSMFGRIINFPDEGMPEVTWATAG